MRLILSAILLTALVAQADVTPDIAWKTDCQAPAAYPVTLTAGESINMRIQYMLRSSVLPLTNATRVAFLFRSSGTTNTPYEIEGSVFNATNGTVRIPWSSSNVVTVGAYDYRVLVSGESAANLRAFGTLTVEAGLGTVSGAPPPYVTLLTSNLVFGMIAVESARAQSAETNILVTASQALVVAQAAGVNITPGAWRNSNWFDLAWAVNPTNTADSSTFRTNLDQVIQRQGFNNVRHDRVAQISEQHSFFDLAFSVSPTNRAVINQSGYLTHLADGVVTASVTAASFGRTNALMLLTEGLAVDRYWSGTTGSLRAASIAAVDGSVTGATMEIFSTYATNTMTFVRNTNLWLRPAPECLAAWNSRSEHLYGGVLITPRHAIAAWHFSPQVGDTMAWVSSNNVVTQAVVLAISNPAADISIVRLDRAVNGIPLAKFISDPEGVLPTGIREIPLALGEVHGGAHRMQLVIGGSAGWNERGYWGIGWWKAPERPSWRDLFYHYPISGDSSQPVLLTTGRDLVLLFCLFYPSSGPNVHAYLPEILAGIAAWGDTNQVEYLSTSTYTEF